MLRKKPKPPSVSVAVFRLFLSCNLIIQRFSSFCNINRSTAFFRFPLISTQFDISFGHSNPISAVKWRKASQKTRKNIRNIPNDQSSSSFAELTKTETVFKNTCSECFLLCNATASNTHGSPQKKPPRKNAISLSAILCP